MIQRHVFVSGTVQGVSFRLSTAQLATQYPSLKGFVRNLTDGRVEAIFAGEESEVLAMCAWCKQGPPRAHVTNLEVIEESVDPKLEKFRSIYKEPISKEEEQPSSLKQALSNRRN